MTPHSPDEVDTNSLTIEATDPIAGTAEYKATAIRVEKVSATTEDDRKRPLPRDGEVTYGKLHTVSGQ